MKADRVVTIVLVQDMDRALRFYRDLLGLSVDREEEDWVVFEEGVGLMLSPEPLPQDSLSMNSVLIGLHVADVDAAYRELTAAGVPFLVGPTDVGGAVVASFRDTEGNFLQLMQG